MAVTADVRDYAAVEGGVRAGRRAELGKIDILIAGQAGNFPAPALGMSANAFKAVVDIDLIGTFNLFRAGFEHLNTPGRLADRHHRGAGGEADAAAEPRLRRQGRGEHAGASAWRSNGGRWACG